MRKSFRIVYVFGFVTLLRSRSNEHDIVILLETSALLRSVQIRMVGPASAMLVARYSSPRLMPCCWTLYSPGSFRRAY